MVCEEEGGRKEGTEGKMKQKYCSSNPKPSSTSNYMHVN